MNQNKIIQATQVDSNNISDIYRLPCVYQIAKEYPTYIKEEQELTSPYRNLVFINTGRNDEVQTDMAVDTDWLCQLQDGTWQVLTDEQYKAISK